MSLRKAGKGVLRLRVGVSLPRAVPVEERPRASPGLGGKRLLFRL